MDAVNGDHVRRVVTGHDGSGRSAIKSDDVFDTWVLPTGDAAMSLIWTTPTVPVDNNDETDGRDRDPGLTIHAGSVCRIVDMLPGGESPMHRTDSLDFGIVLRGHVELELDDGSITEVGPGDIVVQRGTMHLWRNTSETEPCRIGFVLIEASSVVIDGTPLPAVLP